MLGIKITKLRILILIFLMIVMNYIKKREDEWIREIENRVVIRGNMIREIRYYEEKLNNIKVEIKEGKEEIIMIREKIRELEMNYFRYIMIIILVFVVLSISIIKLNY